MSIFPLYLFKATAFKYTNTHTYTLIQLTIVNVCVCVAVVFLKFMVNAITYNIVINIVELGAHVRMYVCMSVCACSTINQCLNDLTHLLYIDIRTHTNTHTHTHVCQLVGVLVLDLIKLKNIDIGILFKI